MTTSPADIWRQRLWVWVPALTFLLINCLGLLVYQFGYSNRVKTLQQDVRDERDKLAAARVEGQRLEDLLRQAKVNRERVFQLYDEHFSTRRRRLTGITAEINSLARRAGMVPRSISFPEEQIQQYGLIKRSFIFTVDGTYTDLRKFINLIEVSDSFVTLESISLSGGDSAKRLAGQGAGLPQVSAFAPGRLSAGGLAPGAPPAPIPQAAQMLQPAGGPGSPLHMSLVLSTLFGTRNEPKDALAPLPGASAPGSAGSLAPRGKATP